MTGFAISDWNTAYENGAHIVGGAEMLGALQGRAAAFRQSATHALTLDVEGGRYDFFPPAGQPKGVFVFIHGGYWQRTDASWWSHLAAGAVARGWAAVLPWYALCPEVGIGEIVESVGVAIEGAAAKTSGPIVLTGHSAGGHLAAAMSCTLSPLSEAALGRVRHVVPISGLGDLRPLLHTDLNTALQLTDSTAAALSPVLHVPRQGTRLTAWVGGAERAEFRRQNRLLADMWRGLGAWTQAIEEPDKHHFDVIEGLCDPASALLRTALSLEFQETSA
ncbi:MAG: alpha/beta hydrolase [Pseudomonadota bacterium]